MKKTGDAPSPPSSSSLHSLVAVICFVVLVVFWMLAQLPTVSAIKCWECNSNHDRRCMDPFDNSTLFPIDCSKSTSKPTHLDPSDPDTDLRGTMCRKMIQWGVCLNFSGKWGKIRIHKTVGK